MGKMKLYELAKELNLTSKQLLEKAVNLGINVKSHLSNLEGEDVEKLKNNASLKSDEKREEKKETKKDKVEKNKENTKTNKDEQSKEKVKPSKDEQSKEVSKQGRKEKNKKNSDQNKEKKGANQKEAPVIIRREVIIEEQKKEESQRKVEKKEEKTPFVQRKQNKDYNIVYRNKVEKPLTVSELFGLKKEEPKQEPIKAEPPKVEAPKKEEEPKTNETPVKKEEVVTEKKETEKAAEVKPVAKEAFKDNKDYQNRNERGYNNQKQMGKNNNKEFSKNNNSNYNNNNNRNNNYNNRRNDNFQNNRRTDFKNNGDRQNGSFRDRQYNNNYNGNNNNRNGRFNNQNRPGQERGGNNRFNRRPLDEKGIEKNIKNIMTAEVAEKEVTREYNKSIDKQKINNKFDENRNNKKKNRRNHNEDINEGKLKNLKQRDKLSNMFEDSEDSMLDYYDLTTQRGRKGKKKNIKNEEQRNKQKIFKLTEITIPESISVKDLAQELKKTSGEVIMKLMELGIMATLNNELDFDTAFLVAGEFGVTAVKKEEVKEEDVLFDDSEDKESELVTRPPVVVVMGHVDHGKTSLLDAIRKTNVIEGEAGGITQAIGAYQVKINDREITFLDTPGHEAFTAMRARGAQITDIAILIVAANDGVMPQTVEAINHAKSAGIPIIVAINKIDLPDANPQKVKEELMQYELVPEEWGGDTICVEISARNNINIDQLLEMVLLEADVLELKANPHKQAKGVVIEARLDKNKGAIASMLVQRGKLDVGDTIVVGSTIGRIRSMVNDKGKKVKSAGPSMPVEIMGLTEVPEAGDTFYEVKDEKMAKHLIERRKRQAREKSINSMQSVTLDNLFSQMEEGHLKQLNLIVKADVQGSVEALKQSLEKLTNNEVRVKVIHSAAGAVTESDVTLAKVSNAIIIAFNVRPVATAKLEAEKNEVQIKQYSVIYQAIDDVEAAMKGMLDPKFEEEIIGTAEVRQVFKISNVGTVAGAYVLTGKLERNAGVRVIRDDVVIHEGKLASLKRFKDDVKEVAKEFECGIQIEKYNDIQEKDIIEAFVMKEIKR